MHRQHNMMNKENNKIYHPTSTIECDSSKGIVKTGTCYETSRKYCSNIDDTNDDFTIPVVVSTHLNTINKKNNILSKKSNHILHEQQQQQQHYVQNTSSSIFHTAGTKQATTQFFSFSSKKSQSSPHQHQHQHQNQRKPRASLFSTIRQRLKSSIILQNSVLYIDFLTLDNDIYIDHNYLLNHYQDSNNDYLYNINNNNKVDTTNFDLEANYYEQTSDQFDSDIKRNDNTAVRCVTSPRSINDFDNYLLERSWMENKLKVQGSCRRKKKKQVHFSNSCIIVEIPHTSTYTSDELNNMYTCKDFINVIVQKNLFETQYEYELQQMKNRYCSSSSTSSSSPPTTTSIHIQKYMDEDDYYCYEIDNKKVYLHPAHISHQQQQQQQQYYYNYDNNNNNSKDNTTSIGNYYSSFVATSPVYLYPDEQKVRLRLMATTLLEELMFNESYQK